MYCEIYIEHRHSISEADLIAALGGNRLGADIPLHTAYSMSSIYSGMPPRHSLFAHESVDNCFAIVRSVNYQTSTYHLEGNGPTVSVQTLLRAAEKYSRILLLALLEGVRAADLKGVSSTVRVFQDNGKETGMDGKLANFRNIFSEKFAWGELRSSLVSFLGTFVAVHYGLKQESLKAAGASLAIAVVFLLSEGIFKYYRNRGKLQWEVK